MSDLMVDRWAALEQIPCYLKVALGMVYYIRIMVKLILNVFQTPIG